MSSAEPIDYLHSAAAAAPTEALEEFGTQRKLVGVGRTAMLAAALTF